jgi:transcription elongation GreA/GreB family factor
VGRALLDAPIGKKVKVETPRGMRVYVVQKLVG